MCLRGAHASGHLAFGIGKLPTQFISCHIRAGVDRGWAGTSRYQGHQRGARNNPHVGFLGV